MLRAAPLSTTAKTGTVRWPAVKTIWRIGTPPAGYGCSAVG